MTLFFQDIDQLQEIDAHRFPEWFTFFDTVIDVSQQHVQCEQCFLVTKYVIFLRVNIHQNSFLFLLSGKQYHKI